MSNVDSTRPGLIFAASLGLSVVILNVNCKCSNTIIYIRMNAYIYIYIYIYILLVYMTYGDGRLPVRKFLCLMTNNFRSYSNICVYVKCTTNFAIFSVSANCLLLYV